MNQSFKNLFSCLSYSLILLVCGLSLTGCDSGDDLDESFDSMAGDYVYLSLAIGNYSEYYIDAYFGPDSLRAKAQSDTISLEGLRTELSELQQRLIKFNFPEGDSIDILNLRKRRLIKHTESAIAVVDKLSGKTMTFEEEAEKIYGFEFEAMELDQINAIVDRIDSLLPGGGSINSRWQPLRDKFVIPFDKIDTLFMAAITDARRATLMNIGLPQTEMFEVEYVSDQPWSAYNWYKGNYYSLIQVNTDADVFIDRAVDLAAHEGYPGHHTYQTLMERNFITNSYWPEYTVYPLFCPTSFLSEGLAEYGVDMVYSADERYAYERDVLMPMAEMDTTGFALYKSVSSLVGKLDHAGLYAASAYMNGNLDKAETKDFLVKYALMSAEKAAQRVDFIDRYGAYIINYTLGIELVAKYIDRISTNGSPQIKWAAYTDILTNPYLPSDLRVE